MRHHDLRALALACALAVLPSVAAAQVTRTVCATGCDHTSPQAAIDAAGSGDTITLAAGETFTGNFILRLKTLSSPITIRSSAADGNFPPAGTMVTPAHAAFMPTITGPAGGLPVFRTENGANNYVLRFLQIGPTLQGFNEIVRLGLTTTEFYADQPHSITIDRNLIRGGQYFGQKVGVALHGRNLTVTANWIDRIMGQGQDAVGVACVNGSGPLTVVGNHIEAAAENMICGGADPGMHTYAQVAASPAPTLTSATLTSFRSGHTIATAKVGQAISILGGSNTRRLHTYIRSCGTANTTGAQCNGNNITFDAVVSLPDSGAGSDARWGEIFDGILVRRNHFTKDPAWFQTILPAPANPGASASTAAGSLAAGTYYYRIVAENQSGYQNNAALSAPTQEVSATLSATGQVVLVWDAVPGATRYRVYGRISGGTTGYLVTAGAVTTLTDTGAALTAATSVPNGSRWVTKNLFEIKFGRNWQIDSNIFETHVTGHDNGTAIWIKSNNTENTCEFCQTKDVVFEKNIIRNAAGMLNILARNDTGAEEPFPLENVTIRDNLYHWSNSTTHVGVTSSSSTGWGQDTAHTITVNGPTKNVTINHNHILEDMSGGATLYFTSSTPQVNFNYTNNLTKVRTNGVYCAAIGGVSYTKGINCFNAHSGGGSMTGNVFAGGAASAYPGNLTPSITDFESNFLSYQVGGVGPSSNYALTEASAYRLTATDGLDRGANIAAVLAATAGVETGGGGSTATPVNITTVGLDPGVVGTAYSRQLVATGGTLPYSWSKPTGTWPAGISMSAGGLITGTPTVAGSQTVTVRATDSTAGTPLFDDQELTLTINAAPTALSITTASPLPSAQIPNLYTQAIAATGGVTPYTWSLASGSLPPGITQDPNTGTLSGIPTTAGSYSPTIRATDAAGTEVTKAFVLVVAAETFGCATRPPRWNFTEAVIYRRPTMPTAAQCPQIGDVWMNTGTNPPQLRTITQVTPTIQVSDPIGGNQLSLPVPQPGDIMVGNAAGWYDLLTPGAVGSFLSNTSEGPAYVQSVPESALPQTITRTRLNADVFGATNYLVFTGAAAPGAPSSNAFSRIYYDSATSKLKAWEGGVLKDVIGGASRVSLGSNQATTSASLSDLTGMSFALLANTSYEVECTFGVNTTDNASAYLITWTGPASPTFTAAMFTAAGSAAGTINGTHILGNDSGSVLANAQTSGVATLRGVWRNGANAGTLQLRFRAEVAGQTTTVLSGSTCSFAAF